MFARLAILRAHFLGSPVPIRIMSSGQKRPRQEHDEDKSDKKSKGADRDLTKDLRQKLDDYRKKETLMQKIGFLKKLICLMITCEQINYLRVLSLLVVV